LFLDAYLDALAGPELGGPLWLAAKVCLGGILLLLLLTARISIRISWGDSRNGQRQSGLDDLGPEELAHVETIEVGGVYGAPVQHGASPAQNVRDQIQPRFLGFVKDRRDVGLE
jgi:hypothetical protein